MKNVLILFCCIAIVISCKSDPNKQLEAGEIKEGTYHSEEIGWTMIIPRGWEVTHKDVLEEQINDGLKAINQAHWRSA